MFTPKDLSDAFEFLLQQERSVGISDSARTLATDVRSYLVSRGRARFQVDTADDIAEFETLLKSPEVAEAVEARGLALWSMENTGWRLVDHRLPKNGQAAQEFIVRHGAAFGPTCRYCRINEGAHGLGDKLVKDEDGLLHQQCLPAWRECRRMSREHEDQRRSLEQARFTALHESILVLAESGSFAGPMEKFVEALFAVMEPEHVAYWRSNAPSITGYLNHDPSKLGALHKTNIRLWLAEDRSVRLVDLSPPKTTALAAERVAKPVVPGRCCRFCGAAEETATMTYIDGGFVHDQCKVAWYTWSSAAAQHKAASAGQMQKTA